MVNNIKANYRNAEIGNRYNVKYQVKTVGSGTFKSIIDQLDNFSRTEIVYLILEETNG